MKRKTYYARKIADLSIQFWKDKSGTPQMKITTNKSELPGHMDAFLFGLNMAESGLFSENDFSFLRDFCESFLRHTDKKGAAEKNWLKSYCRKCAKELKL